MKRMKKILALVLAAVMMLAMSTVAFAAEPTTPEIVIKAASTQAEGATDTTEYTWYRIFEDQPAVKRIFSDFHYRLSIYWRVKILSDFLL